MTAPQTPITGDVETLAAGRVRPAPIRDLAIWASLLAGTLTLASVAARASDAVGPATLPWWPAQNLSLHVTAGMVVAPLTAGAVLVAASRPAAARMPWSNLLVLSYLASLAWSGALHTDVDPTAAPADTRGAAWAADLLVAFTGSQAGLAIAVVALSGLTVPLVLITAKSVCGPVAARTLAPVLILGPWAAWTTLGLDGIAAAAAAAVLAAGATASGRGVRGWDGFWGAAAAGGLLGIAALLSYGAAWFAVSLLCLYFARRRPLHIVWTAGAALAVLAAAAGFGNSWPAGLVDTYDAAIGSITAHPGQLWWLLLMPALVTASCGPAVVESLRRFGSSVAWPLMTGPLLALMLAPLSGAGPERPEYGWVALCPWLVVAATAPSAGPGRRGPAGALTGRARPTAVPLASAGAGAVAAVLLMYSG